MYFEGHRILQGDEKIKAIENHHSRPQDPGLSPKPHLKVEVLGSSHSVESPSNALRKA